MEAKPNYSKIIPALLIIPVLYLCWLAFAWGIADGYAFDARAIEKHWKAENSFSRTVLVDAIAASEAAVHWAPNHPEYRDQLARYLTVRYLLDRDQATASMIKDHLTHSRAIRPVSPGNWAAFIDIKHYAGEVDDELNEAIIKGAAYGPWEPLMIQAIALAGVANYKDLGIEATAAVEQTLRRGLASPVSGLPMRTAELIELGASGWTIGLTESITSFLVNETWQGRSTPSNIRLSLTLWPLIPADQQEILMIKMINSPGNSFVNQLRLSDKRPVICPRVPRTSQFTRVCRAL